VFFKEQDKIFKSTKDLTGDMVILMDKTEEFEQYLKDGVKAIAAPPSGEQPGVDPMDELMMQLMNNKANCEKLLASGNVKDYNRRESIQLMINQFDQQIKELEKSQALPPDSPFKPPSKHTRSPVKSTTAFKSVLSSQDGNPLSPKDGAQSKRSKLKKLEPAKKLTVEEQIEVSLQEIFHFYSRQHIQHNIAFDEMKDGMKKLDLGEFNGFLRDFQMNLPRQKTNDLFLKAGQNKKEIECHEFKAATILVGTELAHAKLREHVERLKELKKVVEQLELPESYPNNPGTNEYKGELEKTLAVKADRLVKYVDNSLRQRLLMADQMPSIKVKRGNMAHKKKAAAVAGKKKEDENNK